MVVRALIALVALALPGSAWAVPFHQDWTDTALISGDDDWSLVPGIVGYRGDELTAGAGADPQAVLADGAATPVDVIANQTSPSSLFSGGVAEFELADPVVALQPSGTADAPHLVVEIDTSGFRAIRARYVLRDLDASGDDAVQPVAFQYRVGAGGDYANVPAGFVPDATSGPELADRVTPVDVTLPADADDRGLVQLRIVTANSEGADEWVGVDDLAVTGVDARPPAVTVAVAARQRLGRALRVGIAARVRVDEASSLRAELRISRRLARRLRLPVVVGRARAASEAGTTRLVTRFARRARTRLASRAAFRVTLRVVATDAAGNAAVAASRIRLVR